MAQSSNQIAEMKNDMQLPIWEPTPSKAFGLMSRNNLGEFSSITTVINSYSGPGTFGGGGLPLFLEPLSERLPSRNRMGPCG